jgi:hypothetical protein
MNAITNEFLYANGEGLGAGLILHNDPTPIIGRILQFASHMDMITQLNEGKFIAYALVPEYSIAIVYGGIFGRGYKLQMHSGSMEHVEKILNKMAAHYYETKIEPHRARFKRYLI